MPDKPGQTAVVTMTAADYNHAAARVNALAGIADPANKLEVVREKLRIIAGTHPIARRATYIECMELATQALALLQPA